MSQVRPGYLVKQVQQLLRRACDSELRTSGLSVSQYAVLRELADRPGVSAAELARRCFVTRQSLQDVLAGLRQSELVAVGEPTRGRARPVTLTAAGRKWLHSAEKAMTRAENRMLAGLGAAEQRRLSELLQRCAQNLDVAS
jgi:DNA-binding MarR family transcriptional regulator